MPQSSREIVKRCLQFAYPERMPRDLWTLPWAQMHHPEAVAELERRFPRDFVACVSVYSPSARVKGDPHLAGTYRDEWGCVFQNLQDGCIGEIKAPIIPDISDQGNLAPPRELLPADTVAAKARISSFCANTDKFVMAGCNPRPWERYQFLRGTENAMMDLMDPDRRMRHLLDSIHHFYLEEVEFWADTDVDGIAIADDWGSQDRLLIKPAMWREYFKPLYKAYADIARANNKYVFMHSDGHIAEIYEDLIEVGIHAVNSQLFCMDMHDLSERVRGKVTFWGEIDRQHVLPSNDPQVGRDAVRRVAQHMYDPAGGIIAQFEFGLGANPQTAIAVFEEWAEVEDEFRKTRDRSWQT